MAGDETKGTTGNMLGTMAGVGTDTAQGNGAGTVLAGIVGLKFGIPILLFALRFVICFLTTMLGLYLAHVLILESWGLLPVYIDISIPSLFSTGPFSFILYTFKCVWENPFLWAAAFISFSSSMRASGFFGWAKNVFFLFKKKWFLGTTIIVEIVALLNYLVTNAKPLTLWVSYRTIDTLPESVKVWASQNILNSQHDFYHDDVFWFACMTLILLCFHSICWFIVSKYGEMEQSIYSIAGSGDWLQKILGFENVEFKK